jgi:hypothetical protein
MDFYSEEIRPDVCLSAGLECRSCTRASAEALAGACAALVGISLEKAFFQMYSHPACSSMLNHFAGAYHAATSPAPRKPCASVIAA